MGAQYSGYIEFKAKGAPLAFVFPETGVPAVPETYGIVDQAPHPNAAELFMDWFLSPVGQKALAEALLLHSPRSDVPPPGGADTVPLSKMKLLLPRTGTSSRRTVRPSPRSGTASSAPGASLGLSAC